MSIRVKDLLIDGKIPLTENNFNNWVPSLTGEGASGVWTIDISGTANRAITASGVDIYGISDETSLNHGSKMYFGLLINYSGQSVSIGQSNYMYISGQGNAAPRLIGATACPYLRPYNMNLTENHYILFGEKPATSATTDGVTSEKPAYYSNQLKITRVTPNGKDLYTGLFVPDLVVGSNRYSNLLTKKTINIAGNNVPIWGGTLTASDLRTSLGLSNALHFIGTTTITITDGGTQMPYDITSNYSPTVGDVVLFMNYEYIWTNNNCWERLGGDSSYKLLQTAVTDPSIAATGCNSFISNISQDTNGNIIPVKKQIAPLTIKDRFNQLYNYDGSQAMGTISLTSRRCVIGAETAEELNKWYKFAEIVIPGQWPDREIVFKISTGFSNWKSQQDLSGILRAHVRCGGTAGVVEPSQTMLVWEYANAGIDPNNFILVYQNNEIDGQAIASLYVKPTKTLHHHYHFDVIQEHDRRNETHFWNLYSTKTAYESIPDDNQISIGENLSLENLTYCVSSLLTIKNTSELANKINIADIDATQSYYLPGVSSLGATALVKSNIKISGENNNILTNASNVFSQAFALAREDSHTFYGELLIKKPGDIGVSGEVELVLGNEFSPASIDNARGRICIYNQYGSKTQIDAANEDLSNDIQLILPPVGGTLLNSSYMRGTEGATYGVALPETGTIGQIFFKIQEG